MESRSRNFLNAVNLSLAGLMMLCIVGTSAVSAQHKTRQVGELKGLRVQAPAAPAPAQEATTRAVSGQGADAHQEHENELLARQLKAARAHAATARLSGRSDSVLTLADSPWQPFTATWYSPEGGVGTGETTATGTHVKDGWTIAVDPRIIPLGSIVEIRFPDGHSHTYQALDTGGAIVGRRLDIFEASEGICVHNGVQRVLVRIVQTGFGSATANHA